MEVNEVGHRSYYLWLGLWTTIDRTQTTGLSAPELPARLQITVNDQPTVLELATILPRRIGTVEQVYPLPVPSIRGAYYTVTPGQIEDIANGEIIYLHLSGFYEEEGLYRLWEDDLTHLDSFVRHVVERQPW